MTGYLTRPTSETIITPNANGFTVELTGVAATMPIAIPSGLACDRVHVRGKLKYAVDAITFIYLRPNAVNTNCNSRHVGDGTPQNLTDLAIQVANPAGRVEADFELWIDFKKGQGRRAYKCMTSIKDGTAMLAPVQTILGDYNDSTTDITSLVVNPIGANLAAGSWLKAWAVREV